VNRRIAARFYISIRVNLFVPNKCILIFLPFKTSKYLSGLMKQVSLENVALSVSAT
jgi:hypothetical protein